MVIGNFLRTETRWVSGRFLGFIAAVLKRSKEWEVVLLFFLFFFKIFFRRSVGW
jgi:hypothetical protein